VVRADEWKDRLNLSLDSAQIEAGYHRLGTDAGHPCSGRDFQDYFYYDRYRLERKRKRKVIVNDGNRDRGRDDSHDDPDRMRPISTYAEEELSIGYYDEQIQGVLDM
jgi:hypothetical protein